MIIPDLKGVIYVPCEEKAKVKPKKEFEIPAITKNEPDLIESKRAMKRWKNSFGYYCLHPEKFRFSLRDLK
ncbi:MAG: hypothetical protein KGD65_13600 [Candidatus Lokiarchaeota archaeon]|nr:hypothetical protein [Candidatus Lokiarchaeota archaeon]